MILIYLHNLFPLYFAINLKQIKGYSFDNLNKQKSIRLRIYKMLVSTVSLLFLPAPFLPRPPVYFLSEAVRQVLTIFVTTFYTEFKGGALPYDGFIN